MQNQLTEAHRQATRKWYAANKEKHKVLRDRYRAKHRAEIRVYNRAYRLAHLGLYTAHSRAYTLRKQRAMPTWADKAEIQRFYAARPEGMHVDHIIPLRGKTVSGLHVLENLQYLPGIENNKKSNAYG
jgi:hypothetical protein